MLRVMRPAVTYIPHATSSREKTGDVIKLAKFEEGKILTETCNNAEIGDESDNESSIISEQDMEILIPVIRYWIRHRFLHRYEF